MKRTIVALFSALLLLVGGMSQLTLAQQSSPLKVAQNSTLGAFLTDASGRTIYLYEKDTQPNQSACTGQCATNWPPVTATDATALPDGVPGALTTFDRADGTKQVAYNGIPLYYFAKDTKAGDVNGQGIGGVWFVVAPGATFGPYPPAAGKGTPTPASTVLVGFTTEYGPFLTDAKGMTLYTFNKDTPGKSTCSGDCLKEWPPLAASSDSLMLPPGIGGSLSTVTRDDGTKQVAYNGKPLYTFDEDKKSGDVKGNNQDDFVVAKVEGGTNAATPEATGAAGAASNQPTATTAASGSSAAASAVSIKNFAFSPDTLNVSVGTTVTWTNNDSTTHTVTADDGSFDSGNLDSGKSFTFTFKKAGTFSYHCSIHPNMKATIVVK